MDTMSPGARCREKGRPLCGILGETRCLSPVVETTRQHSWSVCPEGQGGRTRGRGRLSRQTRRPSRGRQSVWERELGRLRGQNLAGRHSDLHPEDDSTDSRKQVPSPTGQGGSRPGGSWGRELAGCPSCLRSDPWAVWADTGRHAHSGCSVPHMTWELACRYRGDGHAAPCPDPQAAPAQDPQKDTVVCLSLRVGVLVPSPPLAKDPTPHTGRHSPVRGPQQEVAGLQGVCLLSGLKLRLHSRDHHAPGLDRTPPPTAPHTRLCHGGRGSLGASSAVLLVRASSSAVLLVRACSRNSRSSPLGRGGYAAP